MATSNFDSAPSSPADPTDRFTVEGEQWSAGCWAWRLATEEVLSVAEEEMAPGTQEQWHVHEHATQYFYVLDGELELRLPDHALVSLSARQGAVVRPGQPHQVAALGTVGANFLVISAPSTTGDRRLVPTPAARNREVDE